MRRVHALPMQERVLERGLSETSRFSLFHLLKPKTVAEHTYSVAKTALWMAILLSSRGVKIDILKLLIMALVHDEEEMVGGDIPHQTKHPDPPNTEIEKFFEDLAREQINVLYSNMPEAVRERMVGCWEEAQAHSSIEAQVVKLADLLSGISECIEERRLGNQTLAQEEQNYLVLYRGAKAEFYPWVHLIDEFLPSGK